MSEHGVHLAHCYQGEYDDSCKYGDDDCPAKPAEVVEAGTVQATFTLAMNAKSRPDLRKFEAQARLRLAAAVMAMDAVRDAGEVGIAEQDATNEALTDYGNALAALIRKEDPPL